MYKTFHSDVSNSKPEGEGGGELKMCHMRNANNIWSKFDFPGYFVVHPQREENWVVSTIYFLMDEKWGLGRIVIWNFEKWNEWTWMKVVPLEQKLDKYFVHRTMLPLAGHWQPVWSKKQDCRIKLIWYLNTIDKVPMFPYCAYQVYEHAVCIPLGLLKKVVNEVLCKGTPYLRSFLSNATSNQRTVYGVY